MMLSKVSSPAFSYSKNSILAGMALALVVDNVAFIQTFQYTKEEASAYESLKETELTKMCMQISESSLSEEWNNMDDAHWASFESID